MSIVTGVALNAVFPSGLIDRPGQTAVPPVKQDSPLFSTVSQAEPSERGLNRRELNPDERRQDNQRGRPLTPPNESRKDGSRSEDGAEQLRTRQGLEAAQRRGDLNTEQEAKLAEIQRLAERDREVRAHEEAHRAVAGQYAGPISYQFVQGPDGRRYAVAGEVPIDLSPAPTPEQTAAKMEQVRRAALAPAEPSPADRQIASEAMQVMLEARQEAVRLRTQSEDEANSDVDSTEVTDSSGRSENVNAESRVQSEPERATSAAETSEDDDLQDRVNDDTERDVALDERRNAINTESAMRQAELQALVAEILRNQGASLEDVILGRNVNFQI